MAFCELGIARIPGDKGGRMRGKLRTDRNERAIRAAVAQNALEGLRTPQTVIDDMRRAGGGEIKPEMVLKNIYRRCGRETLLKPR